MLVCGDHFDLGGPWQQEQGLGEFVTTSPPAETCFFLGTVMKKNTRGVTVKFDYDKTTAVFQETHIFRVLEDNENESGAIDPSFVFRKDGTKHPVKGLMVFKGGKNDPHPPVFYDSSEVKDGEAGLLPPEDPAEGIPMVVEVSEMEIGPPEPSVTEFTAPDGNATVMEVPLSNAEMALENDFEEEIILSPISLTSPKKTRNKRKTQEPHHPSPTQSSLLQSPQSSPLKTPCRKTMKTQKAPTERKERGYDEGSEEEDIIDEEEESIDLMTDREDEVDSYYESTELIWNSTIATERDARKDELLKKFVDAEWEAP